MLYDQASLYHPTWNLQLAVHYFTFDCVRDHLLLFHYTEGVMEYLLLVIG